MFEDVKDALIAAVRDGATVDEATRSVGVNVNTARSWLAKGRKDPQGRYGRFASEVDALRNLRRLPSRSELQAMTRDELEGLLAERVRAGSVPAMALWVKLHRGEFEGMAEDPFAEFGP